MIHHVEAFLFDMLELHLLSPVKVLDLCEGKLVARVRLMGVGEAGDQFF